MIPRSIKELEKENAELLQILIDIRNLFSYEEALQAGAINYPRNVLTLVQNSMATS